MLQFANLIMTNNDNLSDDEKDLFKKAMQDVKPLRLKAKNTYKKTITISPIKKHHLNEILIPTYITNKYPSVESEETLIFARNGISKKQLNDLKNARENYTARLDLHGLSPDKATIALSNFINQQYTINNKIILIIHGKSGRDNKPPVVKNMVNNYLRQMPEVLAFHSAKPKDGGTGALYVLLKTPRIL